MPTAHNTSAKNQHVDASKTKSTKPQQQQQTNKPNNAKTTLETGSQENESTTQDQMVTSATNASGGAGVGGVKTPPEQPEFIKQALIIIEKKVRNLEKRRQKLEEYKENQRKGTVLNEDQLNAVSKYEEVLRSLELSRELEKQFVGLANDAMKQQKKQLKKEQLERDEQVRERVKESQKYISVLEAFGDETVRNDFLNEINGAFKLTENELKLLDDFDKLVKPAELGARFEQSTAEIAEHLTNLIDNKNKPIQSMNVSYSELRKLFDRLMTASYWTREPVVEQPAEQAQPTQTQPEQTDLTTTTTNTNTNEQIDLETQSNPVQLAEQQQQHQEITHEDHQQTGQIEQTLYHQQNTSDDYVLVSSNDVNDNQSKSPSQQQHQQLQQQQQQAQTKTFFTTLNPADLPAHRNINEFLNRCENNDDGINFLQDSEIQLRQREQEQLQQQQQQQQNELVFQQQSQPPTGGYSYNQDPNHPDNLKDIQYKQRSHNGGQGNGQRPYQGQRPRYTDDRRQGGGPGMPPRNNANSAPQQRNPNQPANHSSQPYNGQRSNNNGGGYRSGSGPSNPNPNQSNRNNYYRGPPNQSNQGGYRNANGPRSGGYQQPPQRMNHDNVHDNQQPQMA